MLELLRERPGGRRRGRVGADDEQTQADANRRTSARSWPAPSSGCAGRAGRLNSRAVAHAAARAGPAAKTTPRTRVPVEELGGGPGRQQHHRRPPARRLRRLRPWASRRSRTPALMARAAAKGLTAPGSTSASGVDTGCAGTAEYPCRDVQKADDHDGRTYQAGHRLRSVDRGRFGGPARNLSRLIAIYPARHRFPLLRERSCGRRPRQPPECGASTRTTSGSSGFTLSSENISPVTRKSTDCSWVSPVIRSWRWPSSPVCCCSRPRSGSGPALGPHLACVAGRIGLLLATQLALFSAVGLAANKSFLFYGSWADLFGQETSIGKVVDHSMSSKDIKVVDKQKLDVPGGAKPQVGWTDPEGCHNRAEVEDNEPRVRVAPAGVLPAPAQGPELPRAPSC